MQFRGVPYNRTQLRMTQEMIIDLYQTAVKNYSSFVENLDLLHITTEKSQEKSTEKAEDTLAAWIDGLHIDDAEDGEPRHAHHRCGRYNVASINHAQLELYRCSHCQNPSAILRRCSGCGKTRYVTEFLFFIKSDLGPFKTT